MGVLKKEVDGNNDLFVTQTLPEGNKKMINDLKTIVEKDQDTQQ